ncbi:hypothetical protein SY88_13855 [Clostridiales bacterium PH28_bin88]|nr:hypothetical protein SY88_13855 [Clostridiales bacterium PH28_bin88]
MTGLLRVEALVKSFDGFQAINRVDLQIQAGILTSIIGPNGAGKTTLINLITGKINPDAGRVYLDNTEITRLPIHERIKKGISRSFQIGDIFPRLTVFQNIQLPVFARLGYAASPLASRERFLEANEEIEEIMHDVGLWDQKSQPAGALSHGDKRLLEIGMAIAPRPRLCFLDEPCAGMNPVEHRQVLDLIIRLAEERNLTFVIVEHDMDVVFSVSDRVVVMNKGEILADGTPDMIREHEGVREIYLGEEVLG